MPILAATKESIDRAAEALARGEIVAFPTETVYGLGANALDASAVAKVFAAKDRPRFNPLIVHVLGLEEAESYAAVNDTARKLMRAFWPGPLSSGAAARNAAAPSPISSAPVSTPSRSAPRAIQSPARCLKLRSFPSPRRAPTVRAASARPPRPMSRRSLDDLPAMILDGGPCTLGLESTVLGIDGDDVTLLRLGALPREEIETVLGRKLAAREAGSHVTSPGQLATHYAPVTPLRLDAGKRAQRRSVARLRPERAKLRRARDQSQPARRSRRSRGEFLRRAARRSMKPA